ncbi:MAG: glycoside hydrolase family 3 N-terminal domain-containing protein [Pyrinomonadaceae bacterium]
MNYRSIEEKVGQLFFIGIPGPDLDEQTRNLLADIQPGGICLFARNIREAVQTRYLLDSITQVLPIQPFLSLDQEGGLVDRLRRILKPMPAPGKFKTVGEIETFSAIIAEAVRILGFNLNFAPVVDVIDESRSKFSNGLHSRSFGKSEDGTVELAGAFLNTLQENGCIGCIKHFPGLGASEVDSHEELPNVSINSDELNTVDLHPYKQLLETKEVAAVMIAHAAYPKLDLQERDQSGKLLPSSLSFNIVTKLLRQQLGFDGLVLTDDLEMGAILKNYGIGEACVFAILAGEDMLSICAGVDSIYEGHTAIMTAVESGRISESRINQSLKRIEAAKSKLSPPLPFDTDRLNSLSTAIIELNDRLN